MGRYNRTPDSDLVIAAAVEYTATGTSTAVEIPSVGAGDSSLELMLDIDALGGTHDATNHFVIELEAGETSGGTFYIVDGVAVTSDTVAVGANVIGLNARQISEAVGSQDAAFYRLNITKVGTTATGATLSADFTKGK